MKKIPMVVFPYKEDISKIRDVLNEAGHYLSDNGIAFMYSFWCEDNWAAGWIDPDDVDLKKFAKLVLDKSCL
jgi:hypothetical protein